MATEDPEDKFAEYQKPGDQYEPEIAGPLIGEKKPTTDLVEEFAQGDPNFARKTAALPSTYPSYRTSKGDGNCGWRAIGFAYFELLLRLRSPPLLESEATRLGAATKQIQALPNFEPSLVEDFVEPVATLLGSLREWIDLPPAGGEELLRAAWCEAGASSYMTFHFRLLAAAHFSAHADDFLPYLLSAEGDMPSAEEYVQTLLTANEQLDEVSLSLLYAALLAPAGLGLEVLNLNRSDNESVDVVARVEEGLLPGCEEWGERPTVRLLYRPGHYDLVYKESSDVV